MKTTATSSTDFRPLADALRRDVLRSTDAAGSGHPTSCLSCAEIMAVLFFDRLRFDVSQPTRLDNDHFVLSKGHAAPILWAAMHRAGAISEEDLLDLRQLGSPMEGHPTPRADWVRVATGSLGQGLSAALGRAWVDRDESRRNRTYVLLGDGEIAEGACWEAAQIASHEKLDRVCAIVDVNARGQTGPTMVEHDLATYARRFEAFGWQALSVTDGHDPAALQHAFDQAEAETDRPSVILARTIKGAGVEEIEGAAGAHGKPAPDVDSALKEVDGETVEIPVKMRSPESHPVVAPARHETMPLPRPEALFTEPLSPRKAFGKALADWGVEAEDVVVFDGEVSNSTYTAKFAELFPKRFIPSFIAEQNMVGMALGAAQVGRRPVVATFAAFLTRAFDQIRMAAISQARMIFAGTHAGIATGEDGPSQMGLEDLAMFRVVPGSAVLQPADAPSTVALLECLEDWTGIGYLRLFRPDVPPLYDASARFRLGGSHALRKSKHDTVALMASGHTVHAALAAADELAEVGIRARVIDFYSIKPLDHETAARTHAEIGCGIVVEDHYAEGGLGEAIAHSLPLDQRSWRHLAVREVPRSGSADELADRYGLSAQRIVAQVHKLLDELAS